MCYYYGPPDSVYERLGAHRRLAFWRVLCHFKEPVHGPAYMLSCLSRAFWIVLLHFLLHSSLPFYCSVFDHGCLHDAPDELSG